MKKILLIYLLFIIPINICFSQDKSIKKNFKESDRLFYLEEYEASYLKLESIIQQYPDNAFYNYKFGVLSFAISDYQQSATYYFEKANKNVSTKTKNSYKETKAPIENWYYLGKINHLNYKFDTAIFYLNKYIEVSRDKDLKDEANHLLIACENGKEYLNTALDISVIPIGTNINSNYNDHSPVISGDMKTLIFTSRRPGTGRLKADDGLYYEDIYISHYNDDNWSVPTSISQNINTNFHEASIGLSSDGTILYIYKSVNGGDIFTSNYDGKSWSIPESVGQKINSPKKESHATISIDKKTLYFSSNRKGGFGGMDIYKSELQEDGSWGEPINLGNIVNSSSDEISPYLQKNDSTLFISSDRETSMGGYDVYHSDLQKDGTWSEPKNIGYPINSPNDDMHYIQSANGSLAIYSSNQLGTEGDLNLYTITLQSKINIAVIVGQIYSDDENKSLKNLKVHIIDNETLDTIQHYYPSETGEFTCVLPLEKKYTLICTSQGYMPHVQELKISENANYNNTKSVIILQPIILGRTGVNYNIKFTKGSSNLSYEAEATLNIISETLKKYKELTAEIQLPETNDLLKQRRKTSITNYLTGQGIDTSRYSIVDYYPTDKYDIFIADTSFINMGTRNWDIEFDKNNQLDIISKHKLNQILFYLKNDASLCIQIPVYSSNGQSQNQANSLYDFFIENGIDTSQVIV